MEVDGTDAVGNTPAQFTDEVKREVEKWRELVRKANLSSVR
jgi:tripartite-type tricarboxylate transporter receptor subunit TctC